MVSSLGLGMTSAHRFLRARTLSAPRPSDNWGGGREVRCTCIHAYMYMFLMRDEKEERKKQACTCMQEGGSEGERTGMNKTKICAMTSRG